MSGQYPLYTKRSANFCAVFFCLNRDTKKKVPPHSVVCSIQLPKVPAEFVWYNFWGMLTPEKPPTFNLLDVGKVPDNQIGKHWSDLRK